MIVHLFAFSVPASSNKSTLLRLRKREANKRYYEKLLAEPHRYQKMRQQKNLYLQQVKARAQRQQQQR
jgi:hypothetical protein